MGGGGGSTVDAQQNAIVLTVEARLSLSLGEFRFAGKFRLFECLIFVVGAIYANWHSDFIRLCYMFTVLPPNAMQKLPKLVTQTQ